MPEPVEQTIALSTIDIDNSPQARLRLSEDTINDYKEKLEKGEEFPALKVMEVKTESGVKRWLTDGHHTYNALIALGRERYKSVVTPGTEDDAFWAAMQANSKHGLQRTNADKRNAVTQALKFCNFKLSSRTIAERTGTSAPFVEGIRKPLEEAMDNKEKQREGKDGRKVSKKEKPAKPEPAHEQHELGMQSDPAPAPAKPLANKMSDAEKPVREKLASAITDATDVLIGLDDSSTPTKLKAAAKELEKYPELFRKLATELSAVAGKE